MKGGTGFQEKLTLPRRMASLSIRRTFFEVSGIADISFFKTNPLLSFARMLNVVDDCRNNDEDDNDGFSLFAPGIYDYGQYVSVYFDISGKDLPSLLPLPPPRVRETNKCVFAVLLFSPPANT